MGTPAPDQPGARELDARWAATNDRKRQPALARGRILLPLSGFECWEDAATDLQRIRNGLQARREGLPFGVPEVSVTGTGREHEVVVSEYAAVGQHNPMAIQIDSGDFAKPHSDGFSGSSA
jgi:hypothetical protein